MLSNTYEPLPTSPSSSSNNVSEKPSPRPRARTTLLQRRPLLLLFSAVLALAVILASLTALLYSLQSERCRNRTAQDWRADGPTPPIALSTFFPSPSPTPTLRIQRSEKILQKRNEIDILSGEGEPVQTTTLPPSPSPTGREEYSIQYKNGTPHGTYVKTTRPIVNPQGYTIGTLNGAYVNLPKPKETVGKKGRQTTTIPRPKQTGHGELKV